MRSERGDTSAVRPAAYPFTSSRKPSCGNTRFTNPSSRASAASIVRDENSRSAAFASPTMRGSIQAIPYSATRPRFETLERHRRDAVRYFIEDLVVGHIDWSDAEVVSAPVDDGFLDVFGRELIRENHAYQAGDFGIRGEAQGDELRLRKFADPWPE